jgi:CRP-like cAMP-binding protein
MPTTTDATDVLTRKLREHTRVTRGDAEALQALPHAIRTLYAGDDIIHQGDNPRASVLVIDGMVARYHTRPNGGRQYLSFHIAGDLPDLQCLFLNHMDHSVCAMSDTARIALFPHKGLWKVFETRPSLSIAFWRETLIDAAIFREAITNNSSRDVQTRIAHLLCEQFYRARAAGLGSTDSCDLPISQSQLGETLGISVVTANRALQALRRTGTVDFRDRTVIVRDWPRLQELAEFDPRYLHLTRQSRI